MHNVENREQAQSNELKRMENLQLKLSVYTFQHCKSLRKRVKTYPMLDNCSKGSLIKEEIIEELEITRKNIKHLTGEKSEDISAVNGFICGKEGPVS